MGVEADNLLLSLRVRTGGALDASPRTMRGRVATVRLTCALERFLESSTNPERRYECELWLEEWEPVGIDTTSIHRGIGEFRDPIGTAEHLVLTGRCRLQPARGMNKTLESLAVEFSDQSRPEVVRVAQQRIGRAQHCSSRSAPLREKRHRAGDLEEPARRGLSNRDPQSPLRHHIDAVAGNARPIDAQGVAVKSDYFPLDRHACV
jgi:hypothetical protein